MPTRTLPSRPSLEHLKYQAKDLVKAFLAGDREALQILREFHPRFSSFSDIEIRALKFSLTDAQLVVARSYGFASWARLKGYLGKLGLDLSVQERIADPLFRRAVDLMDSGDLDGLRLLLSLHPELLKARVELEGGNYFRNPSLLEFAAENPVRHGSLPANIVGIVRMLLEAGCIGASGALELVSSGRVVRECGMQVALIDVLCEFGTAPDGAVRAALGHGEFEAVSALLRWGAKLDLPVAAGLGRASEVADLLASADEGQRHLALAYAAQFGRTEVVRLLLGAGVDVNRYNPVGAHSHSTPLHQAALGGHLDVVKALVLGGASVEARDILFHGTPLGWAEHGGKSEVAEYLRSVGG